MDIKITDYSLEMSDGGNDFGHDDFIQDKDNWDN